MVAPAQPRHQQQHCLCLSVQVGRMLSRALTGPLLLQSRPSRSFLLRHVLRSPSQPPVVTARHGFPIVAKRHVRSLELHRSQRHCRQSDERHATLPNVVDTSETGLDWRDHVAFSDAITKPS